MSGGGERIRDAYQRAQNVALELDEGESEWPAIDPVALEGLPGDVVRAYAPASEADPVALLAHFLVGFGSMIGRTARFMVEDTPHCANEFVLLVGPSARARKGTAEKRIRAFLRQVDALWDNDRVVSGLVSGEGLIEHVRDPQDVDSAGGDKRLLVIESEFASVLRVMKREGNTLSAVLRKAWDDGNLRNLTKNSPARATGAHVSIIGHATTEDIKRYLDRTDCANGFANRFLFLLVRRSQFLPFGASVSPDVIAPLVARTRDAVDFARRTNTLVFSADAAVAWRNVYPVLSGERPGLFGSITARAEAHVLRLAVMYALLELSPAIERRHLSSAVAVWSYAEASAAFVFGRSTGNTDADAILEALRRSPEGLTRSEISNLVFQKNRSGEAIREALRVLQRTGLAAFRATPVKEGQRRPAEQWFAITQGYGNYEINEIAPLEESGASA